MKVRTTIALEKDFLEKVDSRVLNASSRSERIEFDLTMYMTLLDVGKRLIFKNFTKNEVLCLSARAYGEYVDHSQASFWLEKRLQHLAYSEVEDVEDYDEEFEVNRLELRDKVANLSLIEKISLLDYLNQTCRQSIDEAVKTILRDFGGET